MSDARRLWSERNLRLLFDASLWFKAVFALLETVAGVVAYVSPKTLLLGLVRWVTKDEFAEDPHDPVANFLLHSVQHLSVGAQEFAACYLAAHGVIKLWLIAGLLRKRLWYYPVAIAVFGLFIAYQLYRYVFLTRSIWLLFVTALDALVIGLTWHEARYLRRTAGPAAEAT